MNSPLTFYGFTTLYLSLIQASSTPLIRIKPGWSWGGYMAAGGVKAWRQEGVFITVANGWNCAFFLSWESGVFLVWVGVAGW
ncbi:MAG TPA: hypothetical protein DCG19_12265 [Cryomorphaceae bacterium]|nr:hypothetical protein [Owenweeksia sp.]MBF99188.1 hypothetical protein [Owenweeksia sp.]HAD98175.1 hypothetical protein [Cryomorphaceae bacterium]|tara:strand:+ start:1423 stop:1668 length:246 start_codon:yes stop_codon:yes gene_type:complete